MVEKFEREKEQLMRDSINEKEDLVRQYEKRLQEMQDEYE
jgi:hypothetical protein